MFLGDVIRTAVRRLLRQPRFSAAAVLLLALALGANTAIFSVVNAVLLRPLPYADSERLVWIWATRVDRDKAFFSLPDYVDILAQNRTLAAFEAFGTWGVNRVERGEPRRLTGLRVTPGFFETLGVRPALGRFIAPSDALSGERPVVLSYTTWARDYGADATVAGTRIRLNDAFYTVVGVTGPEFLFPGAEAEMITLLDPATDPLRGERGTNFMRSVGRLKPGVTASAAEADLAAITRRLRDAHPVANGKKTDPRVIPLHREITGPFRVVLRATLGAVALVLLLGCANLGNLLLARASARTTEFAVRRALGASTTRIAFEVAVESALLAAAGLAAGLYGARAVQRYWSRVAPPDMPRIDTVTLDGTVLAYAVGIAAGAALLCSVGPALHARRPERPHRFRTALVAGEVALCVALAVNTLLLVGSLQALPEPGFVPDGLVQTRLSLPARDAEAVRTFVDALEAQLPVAAANALPLSGLNIRTDFSIVGRPPVKPTEQPGAQQRYVNPGYFRMLGIPIRQGREFEDRDNAGAKLVAVIDEAAARMFWGGEDPVGTHILFEKQEVEIAGVVGQVKHFTMEEEPLPTLYFPTMQASGLYARFLASGLSIAARTSPEKLRTAVRAANSQTPLGAVQPMSQFVDSALALRRFHVRLFGAFSAVALALAATGIFAVVSFDTRQRSREFAIKSALGAEGWRLARDAYRRPLRAIAVGIAVGSVLALAGGRAIESMLYGVTPYSAGTLAAVVAGVAAVGLAAVAAPAVRLLRADPSGVTRSLQTRQ